MKKLVVSLTCAAFALGLSALLSSTDTGAAPCGGRGKHKSQGYSNCKKCIVPEGCTIVECDTCGCSLSCPQGTIRTGCAIESASGRSVQL